MAIVLGGFYVAQNFEQKQLSIKISAISHFSRRKKGPAESTTKRLSRVHQFSKIELFEIAHPDDATQQIKEFRIMIEDMFSSSKRIKIQLVRIVLARSLFFQTWALFVS